MCIRDSHGTIVKKDGSHVEINIGEDENDPVFGVTDLLVHLSLIHI